MCGEKRLETRLGRVETDQNESQEHPCVLGRCMVQNSPAPPQSQVGFPPNSSQAPGWSLGVGTLEKALNTLLLL